MDIYSQIVNIEINIYICKNFNITANNITPFIATHPGEVIKDELEFRGISQRWIAMETGVSYTQLNENTIYICQKATTHLWIN